MDVCTILIVDDDKEIRDGLRVLLSGENYTILEAADGKQAMALLSDTVDLVILDIMMPGMSGLHVCEEMRKNSSVPILFLTAKAQESDKLMGLIAGGDDYLPKPFSYAELMGRVRRGLWSRIKSSRCVISSCGWTAIKCGSADRRSI